MLEKDWLVFEPRHRASDHRASDQPKALVFDGLEMRLNNYLSPELYT